MKRFTRRLLAIALGLCIILGMLSAVQAEDGAVGAFYFSAMTANNTVVAPEAVYYTQDQTILEALLAAGYEMEMTEDGTVTSINGVEASYLRFYDDGGYDIGVPASEIRALMFCVNPVYSESMLDLICAMGAYNSAANNVQNDPAASEAYADALVQMRSADEQTAKQLYDTLSGAVADYESRLSGTRYDITFQVTQDGQPVEQAAVCMTDAYGNVTEGNGSVSVVAGEYTYSVTDGGVNRTEGKLNVSASDTVEVVLPCGDWFGAVNVLHGEEEDSRIAYESVRTDHHVTWYVDDTADTDSLYLYADQGQVPDQSTQLYALYKGTNDFDYSMIYRSWSSENVKLANLVDLGMEGRTFTLEARYAADDTTQIQTMTVEIVRIPTLKTLEIKQDNSPLYLPFDPAVTEYDLRATQDTITVWADAFVSDGTTVTVNGQAQMTVALEDGKNQVQVNVAHTNGQSRTYLLNIEKTASAAVTLQTPDGVTAEIRNLDGATIAPLADGSYDLIPGDTYECLSTVDTWYHATKQFVASDGMRVEAVVPQTTEFLDAVVFYDRSPASSRKAYQLDTPFESGNHSYVMPVPDTAGALYVQATEAASDIIATVNYKTQSSNVSKCGLDATILIGYDVSNTGAPQYMNAALTSSGYTQVFTVRAQRTVEGVTYFQDYLFTAPKTLHLNSLGGNVDLELMELLNEEKQLTEFSRTQLDYRVQVLSTAKTMTLSGSFPNENTANPVGGGYYVLVNGETFDSIKEAAIDLTEIEDGGKITVQVCHADPQAVSQTYSLTVDKAEPVPVTFRTTPEDAVVFVINNKNGTPVYATEDGSFPLIPGNSYTYNVTARGYNGYSKSHYTAPEQAKTVRVSLEESPENNNLPSYEAEWPSFRQNSDNNGVMHAASPITPGDAVLYWAKKVGLGWYGDACGCPILVDDHIYIYAGEKIFKLDKTTGEVVAEGDMDHSSNFAITNATYGDGMIFVGLSNGSVQAFNAETLESLWLYTDALGGQPNCPIAYYDGYVYTGFWASETANANFVCLSATDEDPGQPMEAKIASWTYTAPGGFYWSGANVNENYVLVGTDDGQTGNSRGYASLVCLDVRSGALLSAVKLPHTGDVRCSITYDESSDAYYFVTKGGYFYQVRVSDDGVIDGAGMRSLQLQNGSGDPASSSSSPTIYNGRAYIGVSGVGAYAPYTGHNISVIDLKNWEIAYRVPTQGNPQTSGVLTTAYDEGDGTVYIYFLDNYTPGKLRVIQDKAGQSEPVELITEVYKEQSYQVAPVLFTPYDAQTQYAICSPIVDSDGTLYFKNDSGYLMAVGTKVESLTLAQAPAKTDYYTGEKFDPTGMQVIAAYANGTTRDVTDALVWNEEALTLQDNTFELVLPMAYQNGEDGQAGVPVESPVLTLELQVTEAAEPVEMPFADVPDNAFYFDPVLWAVDNGITSGTGANKFSPDRTCTRSQVVTFLWRAAGKPAPSSMECTFTDVPANSFYYQAVLWAVENGITSGTGGNRFSPESPCNRDQVVTFLWRASGKPAPENTDCGFTDVAAGSFYYDAMLWAVENGITSGTGGTKFSPTAPCSRGQIVTFLYRAYH